MNDYTVIVAIPAIFTLTGQSRNLADPTGTRVAATFHFHVPRIPMVPINPASLGPAIGPLLLGGYGGAAINLAGSLTLSPDSLGVPSQKRGRGGRRRLHYSTLYPTIPI